MKLFNYIAPGVLITVTALFLTSPVQAKRVGVIFASNYKGNTAMIPELEMCERDARIIERSLKQHGRFDEVKVYLGRMVTASNVTKAIEYVAENTGEDDTVLFYFSGHGTFVRDNSAPNNMVNTVVMFERPHLTDKQLSDMLDEVESKKAVFIFDACYSGGIARKGGSRGVGDIPIAEGTGGTIIANQDEQLYFKDKVIVGSAGSNELAWEVKGSINQGIFSYYFAQALNPANGDLNKDKTVTMHEAFGWTKPRVTALAKKIRKNQTPIMTGNASGIFVSGNIESVPPKPAPVKPGPVNPQPNPNPSPYTPQPTTTDPEDPVTPEEPEVQPSYEKGNVIIATTILKSPNAVKIINALDRIRQKRKGDDQPRKVRVTFSGEEYNTRLQWVNEYQLRAYTGEFIPLGKYVFNGQVKQNQVALLTVYGLPPGVHEMKLEADGYPVYLKPITVEKNKVTKELVVASVAGTGSIRGKVFYENFEQPMGGQEIWMPTTRTVNTVRKMRSLSDGSFWFLNLPAGAGYQIKASFLESLPLDQEYFEVRPGRVTKLDVVLSRKSVKK